MMLKFYGLYKQAVEGPCTDPKPAFYEVVKGYKWRAWSNLGNMTQAQAKTCYVEELKKVSQLFFCHTLQHLFVFQAISSNSERFCSLVNYLEVHLLPQAYS